MHDPDWERRFHRLDKADPKNPVEGNNRTLQFPDEAARSRNRAVALLVGGGVMLLGGALAVSPLLQRLIYQERRENPVPVELTALVEQLRTNQGRILVTTNGRAVAQPPFVATEGWAVQDGAHSVTNHSGVVSERRKYLLFASEAAASATNPPFALSFTISPRSDPLATAGSIRERSGDLTESEPRQPALPEGRVGAPIRAVFLLAADPKSRYFPRLGSNSVELRVVEISRRE